MVQLSPLWVIERGTQATIGEPAGNILRYLSERYIRKLNRYGLLALLSGLVLTFWVMNVSKAGVEVEACLQECSKDGERRDGLLRVMSLNVHHGFPNFENLSSRLNLVIEEIRRQDADIVCLQEVPWTRELGSGAEYLSRSTGLNYLYLRANGNRRAIFFEEGVVILSRYPLKDPGFVELKPQAGFFEQRVALRATAATPWGDVHIFVTHLTNGDPEINQKQVESLALFVESSIRGTAIVAGDFNATEDSPQIESIAHKWVDTYRAANPDDDGLTCCIDNLLSGLTEPIEKRIDYVFLVTGEEQEVELKDTQRILAQPFQVQGSWQWASDHIGLLATIGIKN